MYTPFLIIITKQLVYGNIDYRHEMKRIFHLADTHIGYSAYRKIDEATGLNQREVDTYKAFKQFVDYALKDPPDVILHAGDMFDSVRPTNRAISFVLTQLIRLSEAGIPFVVVSGNHETPRLKETGSVFSLFEHIPGVYVVHRNKYETIELDDITVHAIPHCDDIEGEKDKIKVDKNGFNLAMLHAGIKVRGKPVPVFAMGEINEQIISIDNLRGLDYIALGHYHRCTKVREDAYYAGSTERFSFGEVGDNKGFLEVRLLDDGTRKVIFHQLRIRDMLDLEPVVCDGLDAGEIRRMIKTRILDCNPDDKIVRLRVLGIPLHVYHSLDFDEFKRLTKHAVHFEMRYEFKREEGGPSSYSSASQSAFHSLHTEFEKFVDGYPETLHIDKRRLKELGLEYMRNWNPNEE